MTDYLEGALPPRDARRLERHLETCPGCTEYLEQMRTIAGSLEGSRDESLPAEMRDAPASAAFRTAERRRNARRCRCNWEVKDVALQEAEMAQSDAQTTTPRRADPARVDRPRGHRAAVPALCDGPHGPDARRPSLSAELHPSSTELLWIVDIYGFLVAGFLITMGTLGDRIGRRRLLLIGAAAFGVASVVAAFSSSPEMLIARARAARASPARRWRPRRCR